MKRRVPQPLSPLERTAYHEAGHGVVAYLLRRRLLSVTIEPEGTTLGQCSFAPAPTILTSSPPTGSERTDSACSPASHLWEDLLIIYAGPAAEEVFAGQENVGGSFLDRCEAESLVEALFKGSACECKARTHRQRSTKRQIRAIERQLRMMSATTAPLLPETIGNYYRSIEYQLSRIEYPAEDLSEQLEQIERQLDTIARKSAYLRRLWNEAQALVRMKPCKTAIEQLAQALLRQRTLHGWQAGRMIRLALIGGKTQMSQA